MTPISVTILTGFLGAGKTTLLRHILNVKHGYKIAVIENEFGAESIDSELIGDNATQITTLSNGCICCNRSNELENTLLDLLDGRDKKQLVFDRLIIKCTGMADPGPITQTFFSHNVFCQRFVLDGIIAQVQIGYADCILLTKTDVQSNNSALIARLQRINARAAIYPVIHGDIAIAPLFNLNGFMLSDKLTITKPVFRFMSSTQNAIQSIVIYLDQWVELAELSKMMETLLCRHADNLLRYKGILAIKDQPCRLIFQGVQRLYSADWDREWQAGEVRQGVMVFIGLHLPEEEIRQQFALLTESVN
ncbi:MAG TPA: GTPase [Arsenophonus nasoniae]|uniref:GTPase n=1 Tax=Arsenophonus nasoniae TaxID=638 RepID=UPI00387A44A7